MPKDRFFLAPEESIDVALVATPPTGTFERLKRLKLVQSLWMGVERLLADPAFPRGVPLARLVDPGMVAAEVKRGRLRETGAPFGHDPVKRFVTFLGDDGEPVRVSYGAALFTFARDSVITGPTSA